MMVFTTYCRFFWPKLNPATWNAPSYTLVCWAYCSSYIPFWSDLAYAVALVGIRMVSLAYRDSPWTTYGLAAWGILAFPLGIPALCDAYRRYTAKKHDYDLKPLRSSEQLAPTDDEHLESIVR
ncbi:hypothetical protein ACFQJ8_28040 [Halocatena marina]|uniref:hypothetical protein n=1 Tax=Halocatena marina TaxID=2934937 RepID=UPI003613AF2F